MCSHVEAAKRGRLRGSNGHQALALGGILDVTLFPSGLNHPSKDLRLFVQVCFWSIVTVIEYRQSQDQVG